MSTRVARFAFILIALLPIAAFAARGGDMAAQRAILRSNELVAHARGATELDARTAQDSREATRAILKLQAEAERGFIRLSPARSRALEQALDALEALPAAKSSGPKAVATVSLSGVVTDAGSGLPITSGVSIQVTNFTTQTTSSTAVGAGGAWSITLPAGSYHVRTANSIGYVNQAYNGLACFNTSLCTRYAGTIVTVADGGSATGLNFALSQGGRISGVVRRASDNSIVVGGNVTVVGESGFGFAFAVTDASGAYTIKGLPTGRYRVLFDSSPAVAATLNLSDTLYPGTPCGADDCFYTPAANVNVTLGATTSGIDISAPVVATIRGQITDGASPLAGAFVTLVSDDGATLQDADPAPGDPNGAATDATGNYVFSQVRPGNYRVFAHIPGRLARLYPNVDCFDFNTCDPTAIGGLVAVSPAGNITGVNVALPAGASVSGTITRASDSTPVVGATVSVYNDAEQNGPTAVTDGSGNFTVTGIPDGVAHVFSSAQTLNLADTALGDTPCNIYFDCGQTGPPITVSSGTPVTGVNIRMATGGTISGVLIDGATGAILTRNRARAELYDSAGRYAAVAFQDSAAGYASYGLAPGAYKVSFVSNSVVGWIDTAFGGMYCPRGGCDQSTLPTVFATAGATTGPISATLPRGRLVTGHVADAATGQPIVVPAFDPTFFGGLGFYNDINNYAGFSNIDFAGFYLSRTGFPPTTVFANTFLLRNNFGFGRGYADQEYSGASCPFLSCGPTSGTPIAVTAAGDVTGVDFALVKAGSIAGAVSASGGGGLRGVTLEAYNGAGKLVSRARSNALGGYRLIGLPSGTYFVRTSNNLGYQDKLYNNLSCEPFCNPVTGTPVSVTAPATTAGINFSLDQSASLSGTVSGSHSANVTVELYGAIGNFLRSTTTSGTGNFTFADLAGGRYYLRTRNAYGDADSLFSGQPCVGTACQVRRGTPIDVGPGVVVTGKNLTLSAPGVIAGQVTDQATSNAKSGVLLELYDARGALAASTTTDSTGNYTFDALASGNYYVVTRGTPGYIDESYNNAPCPAACDGLNGTPIAVSAGSTSTANIALAQGAQISGNLNSGASPIVGAIVQVYNAAGVPVGQIATNASGNYQIDTLPDGSFYVRTQNVLGFIDELYNNRPCSGYCDVVNGDPVAIAGGVSVGSINFVLAGGGSISGTVTSSAGGAPIALATLQAYDINGVPAGSTRTDASGHYTVGGLKNGSYRLRTANTAGFVNEIYNAHACSPTPCTLSSGNTIAVSGAVGGIDFALDPGGTISGTATDQFNNPLPTGTATLYDSNGVDIVSAPVADGVWEFDGLANGTYYVLVENDVGLIDQLYNAVPCPAGACNIAAVGTPITLTGGRGAAFTSTAAIDLKLATGQTISGHVKDSATNAPLANATVYFFNASRALVGDGVTDALGDFTSSGGFAPGTYYAATANGVARGVEGGYINGLYSGGNCLLGCDVLTGTSITVNAAPVTGVNFNLGKGIGFAGKVTDAANNPLALVTVEIVDANNQAAGSFTTDSLGHYAVDGLPAGSYYARTRNNLGLQDILYGGAACNGNCNIRSSNPIPTAVGSEPQNINFVLQLPDPLFKDGFE